MLGLKIISIAAAVAILPLIFEGTAAAANPSVNCDAAGQTISAVIASLPPANGYVTLNVSGKCSDNIYIPPNQAIHIIGAKGASLAPAVSANAAISVFGKLEVDNLSVETGSFAAVFAGQGGFAYLLGGTITGPGVGLEVSVGSSALVQDTVIDVIGQYGIYIYAGGNVEIDGIADVFGRSATTITAKAASGNGINCTSGTVLLNTSGGGEIALESNGADGIYASGCNIQAFASAAHPVVIEKTGISGSFSAALNINSGRVVLQGVSIIDNLDYGLDAQENASVQVNGDGTVIERNSGPGISSNQGSSVHILPYNGVNTISRPSGNKNALFSCYQGGKIYVDQIAGTITPAPTSATLGCLTVGGP